MMRIAWRTISALVLAAGLAIATASPASAQAPATLVVSETDVASPTVGAPAPIDQATLVAAVANLESSEFDRVTVVEGDTALTTYEVGRGISLTVAEQRSRLGGGWGPHGLYVDLNRTDQGIVASGGAAALAVALCALPGVGIPPCAVATGVFVAAAAAIAAHGLCGNVLRIHVQQLGYPQCV